LGSIGLKEKANKLLLISESGEPFTRVILKGYNWNFFASSINSDSALKGMITVKIPFGERMRETPSIKSSKGRALSILARSLWSLPEDIVSKKKGGLETIRS